MPLRPSVLAVCALIAGAAVLLLVLRGGDDAAPGGLPRDGELAAESGPGAAHATAPSAIAAPDSPSRTPLASVVPLADEDAIAVRVIAKPTGAPVAGAEVWYLADPYWERLSKAQRWAELRLRHDLELRCRQLGAVTRSDQAGIARVPCVMTTSVACRHGDLYGELELQAERDAGAGVRTLELEPDEMLRIVVVEDDGDPAAGIQVAMRVFRSGRVPGPISSLGWTDGRGNVVAAHLQRRRRVLASEGRWSRVEIFPWIPGETGESSAYIDLLAPPDDPVLLRLPPTARVLVCVESSRGARIGLADYAHLFLAPPREDQTFYGEWWSDPPTGLGEAVFPRVVAGKDYLVRVLSSGVGNLEQRFAVARPGEMTVAVVAPPAMVFLSGRLLDAQHRPIADDYVGFHYSIPGQSGNARVSTDEHGFFRLALTEAEDGFAPRQAEFRYAPPGAARLGASVATGRKLMPGDNELGDVVLTGGPLLAAGRILCDGSPPRLAPSVSVEHAASGRVERWRMLDSVAHDALADGAFELRGSVPEGRLRLRVHARGCAPIPPLAFEPGAEGLRIELKRGGTLGATVLSSAALASDALELVLRPCGDQVPAFPPRPPRADPLEPELPASALTARAEQSREVDGASQLAFAWEWLWPGAYDLLVRTRGVAIPVLEIPGIQIDAGRRTQDARLEAIDLRGKLRAIAVAVRGEDGTALPRNDILVLVDDPAPDVVLASFAVEDDGTARITTGAPALDLFVAAKGWQPQRLRGIQNDITVRLARWPEVVVQVEGPLALPAGARATLALVPETRAPSEHRLYRRPGHSGHLEGWEMPPPSSCDLAGQRTCRVPIAGPGRYGVSVRAHVDATRRAERVADVVPSVIEVGPDSASFSLTIPQAALDAAIRRAGEPASGR